MPLKIYLDKCISHIIYNFTRLFGRKEGNNFFEALEGFSLQTIKEEGDKLGESSEVQPFEWGKSHAQLVAEKALRKTKGQGKKKRKRMTEEKKKVKKKNR